MQTQCNFNNIIWSFVFFSLSACFKRHLVSADVYNRDAFSVSPDAVGPQRLNCHQHRHDWRTRESSVLVSAARCGLAEGGNAPSE